MMGKRRRNAVVVATGVACILSLNARESDAIKVRQKKVPKQKLVAVSGREYKILLNVPTEVSEANKPGGGNKWVDIYRSMDPFTELSGVGSRLMKPRKVDAALMEKLDEAGKMLALDKKTALLPYVWVSTHRRNGDGRVDQTIYPVAIQTNVQRDDALAKQAVEGYLSKLNNRSFDTNKVLRSYDLKYDPGLLIDGKVYGSLWPHQKGERVARMVGRNYGDDWHYRVQLHALDGDSYPASMVNAQLGTDVISTIEKGTQKIVVLGPANDISGILGRKYLLTDEHLWKPVP